ncbi:hypothetical protein ACMCNP_04975 [Candidatus Acidulodesulfobacterium sp. H_13]
MSEEIKNTELQEFSNFVIFQTENGKDEILAYKTALFILSLL